MKQTPAQRLDNAMDRLERTAMELIEKAERYAEQTSLDSKKWQRTYLLSAARSYASAVRHLARVK